MKKLLSILLAVMLMSLMITCAVAEGVTDPTVSPAFSVDITDIIRAVMTVLIGFVVYFIRPYFKNKYVQALVKTAYFAAEQLYDTGVITDKLAYAEEYLKKKGIKVDTRALIEAFVGEMNSYYKELDHQYALEELYSYEDLDEDEDNDSSDAEGSDVNE